MAGYIVLYKFSQQGMQSTDGSANRLEQLKSTAGRFDIRTVGVWVTMGRFDLVGVFDAPNEQAMGRFLFTLGRMGGVTSETMRAFSEEEVASIATGLGSTNQ